MRKLLVLSALSFSTLAVAEMPSQVDVKDIRAEVICVTSSYSVKSDTVKELNTKIAKVDGNIISVSAPALASSSQISSISFCATVTYKAHESQAEASAKITNRINEQK